MPGEPGPEDWQPTLAQTQADRHQAWKACTTVILSEARPALSSARCNPINSNQPAHHRDYFKTNGGFKPSEEGFGRQGLKPEMSVLQVFYEGGICRMLTHQEHHTTTPDDRTTHCHFYF